ncbi:class I SAM-dependent methyltransferase [Acholeplasma sp. OttesenSCG-928-E16]|nr:class I SAM-dependent methyltransferase [Acholeplasma sp. OttesenSCG-928-E16]
MEKKYQDINSKVIDSWVEEGWEWGIPIDQETYKKATQGDWFVLLTPTKKVPKEWFFDLKDKKVLGLASGGGQQMPIFNALGAKCTVLDYSKKQLQSEEEVAKRENYQIEIIHADMTKPLPFADKTFDLIFHPVSNVYVKEVKPIFKECYRVLKDGGILLSGLDNGVNFLFDDDEDKLKYKQPFDPTINIDQYEDSIKNNNGIQFSHSLNEQIGGQLEAGFILTNIYDDTNGYGRLHDFNVNTFFATRAIKKDIKD